MGASSQLWMDKVEKTCEDFEDGKIEEQDFRLSMKGYGFDPQEIDDHVSVANT